MSDLARWGARGPVHRIEEEFAEWNRDLGDWRARTSRRIGAFRPDEQLTETEFNNPDGSITRSAHAYDADGPLLEIRWSRNDETTARMLYSYDSTGRCTGAVEISSDGGRREAESYVYDDQGRRTKVCSLAIPLGDNAVGHGVEGTNHSYRAPGAVTSITTYDDRMLPVEVRFDDANQAMVLRIVFSRDQDGLLLTETAQFRDAGWFGNLKIEDVPQYDDHDNWVERILSARTRPEMDFELSNITRRTITYYVTPRLLKRLDKS